MCCHNNNLISHVWNFIIVIFKKNNNKISIIVKPTITHVEIMKIDINMFSHDIFNSELFEHSELLTL